MRILMASDRALLLELPDLAATMHLYRYARSAGIVGVRELVPAARTVLVHFDPLRTHVDALAQALCKAALKAQALCAPTSTAQAPLVRVPVRYVGEDLPEVAQLLGLTVAQVIAQHTQAPYDAAFAGFAPGFVYLSGGAHFQVPRRLSPRTKVPAGSVALGGAFSAVYPSASPGGWQLIGETHLHMWDLQRTQPALIQPGCRVQFVDVTRQPVQVAMPQQNRSPQVPPVHKQSVLPAIEFVEVGLQALVQDHGRAGRSDWGVSASGALDGEAMHAANRQVGNPMATPVLECVGGPLRMRSHGASTVALAGAVGAITLHSTQGRAWPCDAHRAISLNDGDVLHMQAPQAGVRSYLAVRGGWTVDEVLGSCATDTLAAIGPAPVQPSQRLAVGRAVPAAQLTAVDLDAWPGAALPRSGDTVVLDVVLGPRTDWFTPAALALLTDQPWQVTPHSNRIGMRLAGLQPLPRARHDELPSEGTVNGAIQVPINGQPVLFLADHPLTGGYPVIAAIASYHLSLAAQIPVGCWIRFRISQPMFEDRGLMASAHIAQGIGQEGAP